MLLKFEPQEKFDGQTPSSPFHQYRVSQQQQHKQRTTTYTKNRPNFLTPLAQSTQQRMCQLFERSQKIAPTTTSLRHQPVPCRSDPWATCDGRRFALESNQTIMRVPENAQKRLRTAVRYVPAHQMAHNLRQPIAHRS